MFLNFLKRWKNNFDISKRLNWKIEKTQENLYVYKKYKSYKDIELEEKILEVLIYIKNGNE